MQATVLFYFADVTTTLISTKIGMASLKATAISIQLGMLNPTPPVSSPAAVLSLGPLQQSDSGLPQAAVNIQFSPSHY